MIRLCAVVITVLMNSSSSRYLLVEVYPEAPTYPDAWPNNAVAGTYTPPPFPDVDRYTSGKYYIQQKYA